MGEKRRRRRSTHVERVAGQLYNMQCVWTLPSPERQGKFGHFGNFGSSSRENMQETKEYDR